MKRWIALSVCIALAGLALGLGCAQQGGQAEQLTVLVRMMPAQQRFFREKIVKKFEKLHKCKINIATFNNEWDIERMLKLEAGKKNKLGMFTLQAYDTA